MSTDDSRHGGSVLGGDIFTINIQNMKCVIDGIIKTGTIVRVVIDTYQPDRMQSPG